MLWTNQQDFLKTILWRFLEEHYCNTKQVLLGDANCEELEEEKRTAHSTASIHPVERVPLADSRDSPGTDVKLSLEKFTTFLEKHGTPLPNWSERRVHALWQDVEAGLCALECVEDVLGNKCIRRHIETVIMDVQVVVGSTRRRLLITDVAMSDKTTERGRRRHDIYCRASTKVSHGENIEEASWCCLAENVKLSEVICRQFFEISNITTEDNGVASLSAAYPGMLTVHKTHVVHALVKDIDAPELSHVGKVCFNTLDVDDSYAFLYTWAWCSEEDRSSKEAKLGSHFGKRYQTSGDGLAA